MGDTRLNNSVHYYSPAYQGVTGELMYAFGEQTGMEAAERSAGAALGYSAGPLQTRLFYITHNDVPPMSQYLSTTQKVFGG